MTKRYLSRAALRSFCLAAMILTFGAAFFGQTRSDFNPRYRGAQLVTWGFANKWVNTRDKFGENEIWDLYLRQSLVIELSKVGFRQTETNPNFLVHYRLRTKERERINIFHDDWGYWPGMWPGYSRYWGGWPYWNGGWAGSSMVYTDTYDESSLVVDAVDTATRDLIWRGIDRREMSDKSDKTLRKSARKLSELFAKDVRRNREHMP